MDKQMKNSDNLIIVFTIMILIAFLIWGVAFINKKKMPDRYDGLHPADKNAESVKLSPGRIAAIGITFMMIGVIGCIASLFMLTQAFSFHQQLIWASLGLGLLMSGIFLYGYSLYRIREYIVQLYLGESGFYYADIKILSTRRPFWAILENDKFKFHTYSSIEKVTIVRYFSGNKIKIRSTTSDFTLPVLSDDEQELIWLSNYIKTKARI